MASPSSRPQSKPRPGPGNGAPGNASSPSNKRMTAALGSLFVFDTCKPSDLKNAMDAMESEDLFMQGDSQDFSAQASLDVFHDPSISTISSQYSGTASDLLGPHSHVETQTISLVGPSSPSEVPSEPSMFNVFDSLSYIGVEGNQVSSEGNERKGSFYDDPSSLFSSPSPSSSTSPTSSISGNITVLEEEFGYADEELDAIIDFLDSGGDLMSGLEGKEVELNAGGTKGKGEERNSYFGSLSFVGGSGSSSKPSAFSIIASQLGDDDTGGNDWVKEEAFFNDFQLNPEWISEMKMGKDEGGMLEEEGEAKESTEIKSRTSIHSHAPHSQQASNGLKSSSPSPQSHHPQLQRSISYQVPKTLPFVPGDDTKSHQGAKAPFEGGVGGRGGGQNLSSATPTNQSPSTVVSNPTSASPTPAPTNQTQNPAPFRMPTPLTQSTSMTSPTVNESEKEGKGRELSPHSTTSSAAFKSQQAPPPLSQQSLAHPTHSLTPPASFMLPSTGLMAIPSPIPKKAIPKGMPPPPPVLPQQQTRQQASSSYQPLSSPSSESSKIYSKPIISSPGLSESSIIISSSIYRMRRIMDVTCPFDSIVHDGEALEIENPVALLQPPIPIPPSAGSNHQSPPSFTINIAIIANPYDGIKTLAGLGSHSLSSSLLLSSILSRSSSLPSSSPANSIQTPNAPLVMSKAKVGTTAQSSTQSTPSSQPNQNSSKLGLDASKSFQGFQKGKTLSFASSSLFSTSSHSSPSSIDVPHVLVATMAILNAQGRTKRIVKLLVLSLPPPPSIPAIPSSSSTMDARATTMYQDGDLYTTAVLEAVASAHGSIFSLPSPFKPSSPSHSTPSPNPSSPISWIAKPDIQELNESVKVIQRIHFHSGPVKGNPHIRILTIPSSLAHIHRPSLSESKEGENSFSQNLDSLASHSPLFDPSVRQSHQYGVEMALNWAKAQSIKIMKNCDSPGSVDGSTSVGSSASSLSSVQVALTVEEEWRKELSLNDLFSPSNSHQSGKGGSQSTPQWVFNPILSHIAGQTHAMRMEALMMSFDRIQAIHESHHGMRDGSKVEKDGKARQGPLGMATGGVSGNGANVASGAKLAGSPKGPAYRPSSESPMGYQGGAKSGEFGLKGIEKIPGALGSSPKGIGIDGKSSYIDKRTVAVIGVEGSGKGGFIKRACHTRYSKAMENGGSGDGMMTSTFMMSTMTVGGQNDGSSASVKSSFADVFFNDKRCLVEFLETSSRRENKIAFYRDINRAHAFVFIYSGIHPSPSQVLDIHQSIIDIQNSKTQNRRLSSIAGNTFDKNIPIIIIGTQSLEKTSLQIDPSSSQDESSQDYPSFDPAMMSLPQLLQFHHIPHFSVDISPLHNSELARALQWLYNRIGEDTLKLKGIKASNRPKHSGSISFPSKPPSKSPTPSSSPSLASSSTSSLKLGSIGSLKNTNSASPSSSTSPSSSSNSNASDPKIVAFMKVEALVMKMRGVSNKNPSQPTKPPPMLPICDRRFENGVWIPVASTYLVAGGPGGAGGSNLSSSSSSASSSKNYIGTEDDDLPSSQQQSSSSSSSSSSKKKKILPKCFIGSEAVDWAVEHVVKPEMMQAMRRDAKGGNAKAGNGTLNSNPSTASQSSSSSLSTSQNSYQSMFAGSDGSFLPSTSQLRAIAIETHLQPLLDLAVIRCVSSSSDGANQSLGNSSVSNSTASASQQDSSSNAKFLDAHDAIYRFQMDEDNESVLNTRKVWIGDVELGEIENLALWLFQKIQPFIVPLASINHGEEQNSKRLTSEMEGGSGNSGSSGLSSSGTLSSNTASGTSSPTQYGVHPAMVRNQNSIGNAQNGGMHQSHHGGHQGAIDESSIGVDRHRESPIGLASNSNAVGNGNHLAHSSSSPVMLVGDYGSSSPSPSSSASRSFVIDGEEFKKSQWYGDLLLFSAKLQKINLSKMTHAQKIAFWINVHNILAIHVSIHHGYAGKSKSKRKIIQGKSHYQIEGMIYSLDDIYHGILRGNRKNPSTGKVAFKQSDPRKKNVLHDDSHSTLSTSLYASSHKSSRSANASSRPAFDPRIHFALTHLSRASSPFITPMRADSLDSQLNSLASTFFSAELELNFKHSSLSLPSWLLSFRSDFTKLPAALLTFFSSFLDPERAKNLSFLANKIKEKDIKSKSDDSFPCAPRFKL
jgi:hypothetical protein